jgi:hypothetical protein
MGPTDRRTALGAVENVEMSRSRGLTAAVGRTVVLTTIAALMLTTSETPLNAAPASHPSSGISATTASPDVTDVSARRRQRHYRGGGAAAGAAFMGLAIGAIAGAVAAQQRRDEYYYDPGPGYYQRPGYYYQPGYYDPPPQYYYRQRYHHPF